MPYIHSRLGSSEVVSCLTVGDPLNKGKNSLIVLTTAGWIHIFEVHGDVGWPRLSNSRSNSFSTALRPSRSSSNTMASSGAGGGSTATAAAVAIAKSNEPMKGLKVLALCIFYNFMPLSRISVMFSPLIIAHELQFIVPDSSLRDIGCDTAGLAAQASTYELKPVFSQRFAFNFNAKIVVAAQVTY